MMRINSVYLFLIINLFPFLLQATPDINRTSRKSIDLSGEWTFYLTGLPDSLEAVADRSGILNLPGTLDTNSKGIPVNVSSNTDQLSRRYTYTGPVVLSKKITVPEWAEGKNISLCLERTRPTNIKVDGIDAGGSKVISAAQRIDLTPFMSPGEHLLEITVDNGKAIPAAVRNSSHACAESTQTNWNGIIGNIILEITDPVNISSLAISSDITKRRFIITGTVDRLPETGDLTLSFSCNGREESIVIEDNDPDDFSVSIPLGFNSPLWSEWNPSLYDITVTLRDSNGKILDSITRRSGLREFSTSGTQFTINGQTTFLRGRHDACVWPLTAHVPMDQESWKNYFKILKSYGINHVRFHSWCPPEACFEAADEAGVYLQPELSIWGAVDKSDKELLEFLMEDMEAIIAQYSHHPSFTMFAVGNELWGDTAVMKEFIDRARELMPGLLATYGSNIYLGYDGDIPGEDFLVTCRVGDGPGFTTHARASFSFADAENGGLMNSSRPNTTMNFSNAVGLSGVPVVGHETGQYQMYPDYSSINKYTGVLRPDNLNEFKRRAAENGTLRKAEDFLKASGAWASRLYKADMEMNLRTPGMGGFQLLDLQDYPGQGTALVGMLDPFMDSKGIISEEEWRESCNDITLLAELSRRSFSGGETAEIGLLLADYSPVSMEGRKVTWKLPFSEGESIVPSGDGLLRLDPAVITFPEPDKPQKISLILDCGERAHNSYDIWLFPSKDKFKQKSIITSDLDEALKMLKKGKRVILTPDSATVASTTLGPLFQTDYWNYRMFLSICENIGKEPSPGTLGLLIDEAHPAFDFFPTDSHTDWQWFPIIANSRPLIIDRLPASIDPIIEPIDNVDRNYRLALMLECNVGKGKLLIVMANLEKASETIEGKWFLHSLDEYVSSKSFKPVLNLSPEQIRALLTKPSVKRTLEQLHNISYE